MVVEVVMEVSVARKKIISYRVKYVRSLLQFYLLFILYITCKKSLLEFRVKRKARIKISTRRTNKEIRNETPECCGYEVNESWLKFYTKIIQQNNATITVNVHAHTQAQLHSHTRPPCTH